MWHACKEALLVKENLAISKIYALDLCPLCKEEKESTMHCLVKCKFAALVWFVSPIS